MPARKNPAAKKPKSRARKTATRSAVTRSAGFQVGEVVVDAGMPSRVGTVCVVVTPSRTYRVRFADDTQCIVAPHGALARAPVGTPGPDCTPDC